MNHAMLYHETIVRIIQFGLIQHDGVGNPMTHFSSPW